MDVKMLKYWNNKIKKKESLATAERTIHFSLSFLINI